MEWKDKFIVVQKLKFMHSFTQHPLSRNSEIPHGKQPVPILQAPRRHACLWKAPPPNSVLLDIDFNTWILKEDKYRFYSGNLHSSYIVFILTGPKFISLRCPVWVRLNNTTLKSISPSRYLRVLNINIEKRHHNLCLTQTKSLHFYFCQNLDLIYFRLSFRQSVSILLK